MEQIHDLLEYENLKIYQNNDWFSFSLDSVLLAHYATVPIRTYHIANKNVTTDKLTTEYQTVLGNLYDSTNGTCSEITIQDLADALIPFLEGRV